MTFAGQVWSSGATAISLCGKRIRGPVSIAATAGQLLVGATGCPPNAIKGAVALTRNGGGVVLDGNVLTGPLSCSGNQPPRDRRQAQPVQGPKKGQCATLWRRALEARGQGVDESASMP